MMMINIIDNFIIVFDDDDDDKCNETKQKKKKTQQNKTMFMLNITHFSQVDIPNDKHYESFDFENLRRFINGEILNENVDDVFEDSSNSTFDDIGIHP